MRVEIRKSGGPVCETCGATELVTLPDGGELARDLHALIDAENAKLERDIVAVFETLADDLRASTARAVDELIGEHRLGLLAVFRHRHDDLADGIIAFMDGQEIPRYRLAKKRWHRKIAAELALAVNDLRAQTRLT